MNSTRFSRLYVFAATATWVSVVIALMLLNFRQIRDAQYTMATSDAREHVNEDNAFRFWVASMGGVYVPVTDRIQPNAYLSNIPERDIETPTGKSLTLVNSAYLLRLIMTDYADLYGIRGHLAGLAPSRKETVPDEWEKAALLKFQEGIPETSEVATMGGVSYLRLMKPMYVKEQCLECHKHQNYTVGNVAGGVSVAVPLGPYFARMRSETIFCAACYGIVLLFGLTGILLGRNRLIHHIEERDKTENALRERTAELVNVNAELRAEVEERKRAEVALQQSEREKAILNRIANIFLSIPDEKIYEEVLAVILKVLKCRYGVFGYIGDSGDLIIPSMTKEIWSDCRVAGKSMVFPWHLWGDSLWGKSIKEKKSYSSDGPFQTPEGHLPIYNFLTVPIVSRDKTIGLFSLANKDGGFSVVDKTILERIVCNISPILNTRLQRDKQELERKLAEDALRESEARLRQIIDLVPHKIFVKSCEGKYLLVNKAVAEAYNTSVGDLTGKCHADFHPDESELQKMLQDDREVITKGETKFIPDEPYTDAQGNQVFMQTTKVPFHILGDKTTAVLGVAIDITDKKRAEEALRENQSRLELALRSAHMGVWRIDLVENKRYFDDQVCHLLGIDPAKFTGTPEELYTAVHPHDREMLKAALARTIEQDVPYETEYRAVWPDGSIHYVTTRGKLFRDETGQPVRLNGLIWDFTERRQAQQALSDSEERLSLALASARMGVWEWDLTINTIFWSPECYNIFGVKSFGGNLESFTEIVHPEDRDRVWLRIEQALEQRTIYKDEFRIVQPCGNMRWVTGLGQVQYDADGKPLRFVGNIQDITERKEAEESLIVSEDRYRRLFKDAVLGIFRSTPYGKLVDVNPAYARMFGFDSPEEAQSLVNDAAVDLFVDPSRRDDMMRMISDSKGPVHLENQYKRKDGSIFAGSLHAWAVYDKEGKLLYVEGFVEDISERKRAEEEKEMLEAELRQAQKLEAIGTLAGGIAHDFNNILQPMMGYTEMALRELLPAHPVRDDLEQVLNASLRAKELVRQILAISRSTEERQRIPTDISSIIKEALKLLRSSLPTSIEMRQKIWKGVALADPTQIHQVLMNLCTNAAHAMDDKGILEVHLSPVNLSESDLTDLSIADLKPGPYLRLKVSDTGCGMDASTMEHIFDPYFTTKEVGKGSGLGLAVVNGIVKRHDGAMTVRSEPGKGTTFSVYIPKVDVQPEATLHVEALQPRGSEKILLVDDEPAVMGMGTKLLEHLGYRVTSQTDSVSALEVFRLSPDEFDLVVTDYAMPKLTGLDLARKMLRIRPDIPILLCTGYSEKITPDHVKELGMGLLMKPYGMKQISEEVRKILDAPKGGLI
jgi:PAS domain S-box-containing protein